MNSETSAKRNRLWGNYFATLKFLTIFPTPKVNARISPKLSMFPLVGLTLGFKLWVVAWLFSGLSPLVTAFILLCIWLMVTGFLHLDGLADLADGLGAAHQNPERLLSVMHAPNIGAFGVVALIIIILGKWVLISSLLHAETWAALLLIPAWARLGAAWWASSLNPLTDGLAMWVRQAESINLTPWFILLLLLSLMLSPMLLLAPFILWAWKNFLSAKLGGMNGDCLGAGIEISEVVLLLLVSVTL